MMTEAPLAASEQLALFVSAVEDYAIYLVDPDGRVRTWNVGAERIKGYAADEIVGQHISAFYTAEDRAEGRPERLLVAAASAGSVHDIGWRVRKDGTRFWASVALTAIRGEFGELRGYGKVTRDLTAARAAEEAAAEQAAAEAAREEIARREHWMRTTLRSIGDAVIATDARGHVGLMNAVAEQLTGWREEEAKGKPLSDIFRIVRDPTREIVESPVDRVIREGTIVGLANHTLLIDRSGRERPIDDSGAPIRDDSGALVGVVLVFRDVSERRRIERELEVAHASSEAANARLELLARASAVLGGSLDFDETLQNVPRLAVPRFADWCWLELRGPEGVDRTSIAHVDPEKVALGEQIVARYAPGVMAGICGSGGTGRAELHPQVTDELLRASARDEAHLALIRELGLRSALAVPIVARGRTVGVLAFATAESDRVYGPDDLALAEEIGRRAGVAIDNASLFRDADTANRMKDSFLATLSHELRTPLTSILGWAQMMQRQQLSESDQRRAVDTIYRNARQQAALINDVLDVSRIVSGKLELDPVPLDLVDVVKAAVEAARPQALSRGITFEASTETAAIPMQGDPSRLTQVVANLVGNALKFTPRGGRVTLAVSARGGSARLEVRDTGQGIAPDVLPHIFERFWQADASSKRSHGGLGIGLSIVRHLVSLHGGRVWADSEGLGRGACVVVELPIRAAEVTGEIRGDTGATLRGVHVLLVDDDGDTRTVLAAMLSAGGARVTVASSAEEALATLRAGTFDLMVSDIGMPVVDGYELIRRVREQGIRTPSIALTAFASPRDRERAVEAGFQRHVAKPVDAGDLLAAATGLVEGRFG